MQIAHLKNLLHDEELCGGTRKNIVIYNYGVPEVEISLFKISRAQNLSRASFRN